MYKEQPWTIQPNTEETKSSPNTALEAITLIFHNDKENCYSLSELARITNRSKGCICSALKSLQIRNKVKIVEVKQKGGNLQLTYQSSKGSLPSLRVFSNDEIKLLNLISLSDFIKSNSMNNSVIFRSEVNQSSLNKYLVQTLSGNYCYYYKNSDLRSILKIYEGQNCRKETNSKKEFKFRFLNYEIIIKSL